MKRFVQIEPEPMTAVPVQEKRLVEYLCIIFGTAKIGIQVSESGETSKQRLPVNVNHILSVWISRA